MRSTHRLWLLFASLLLVACRSNFPVTAVAPTNEANRLRTGMSLEAAELLLKAHGATQIYFETELSLQEYRKGSDLHYYTLPSGTVIKLLSHSIGNSRVVASIAVSATPAASWESKIDPARERFFNSFQSLSEYVFPP